MADTGLGLHQYAPHELLALQTGALGFQVVELADGDVVADFVAIKAVGGSVTLGPNCISRIGDNPGEHVIADGDILWGRFSQVDIAAGTAYCYHGKD